jgi:hypothetical protein
MCIYGSIDAWYCYDCARYNSCQHENKTSQKEIDKIKEAKRNT